jgi:hypothetical protein
MRSQMRERERVEEAGVELLGAVVVVEGGMGIDEEDVGDEEEAIPLD